MPRGHNEKPEPLQVQVSLIAPRRMRLDREKIQAIMHDWADEKPLPKGIKVKSIAWRHPNRQVEWRQATDDAGIEDARLNLSRFLFYAHVRISHPESDQER